MASVLQVTTNFIGQAFAILMVTLSENFEWSLTAITLAYFFRNIITAMLSPGAGWLGDRYGARGTLALAGVLYIVGMLLLSGVEQTWQLYLYYSLVLGAAQALFSVNIPTTVAAWFRRRLGLAVGIQQSLGGMGASVMAPALAFLLASTEWETTFRIIPAVGGVVIFALLTRFRSDPADRGMKPYGSTESDPLPVAANNPVMTRLRAQVFMQHVRSTTAFWNLIVIHHLGCVGHAIVMVGVVFYASTQGLSLGQAAWIISI